MIGFIALNGEAGFQPNLLCGGIHFLTPFQYAVHMAPLVTIPQGRIGYIFARDGQPLSPTQMLASNVSAHDFQDVVSFMQTGGQRTVQQVMNRFAEAIQQAKVDVVPRVVIGGNGSDDGGQYNLMEGLMATLLSERMGVSLNDGTGSAPAKPEVVALHEQIYQGLTMPAQNQE